MDNSLLVNLDHHRSRERIKNLGEVFTPEQYVQQMLALFDSKIWADENVIFFEPSAGHGNIVLPILAKRIESLSKKFKRSGEKEPELCAIATSLNTLWAIDICPLNVDYSRKRVFEFVFQKLLAAGMRLNSAKTKDFLAHVLCTILWQIQENEALSALSNGNSAVQQAAKTKLGSLWLKKNKHKPLSFEDDWCSNFQRQKKGKVTPLYFERALKFLDSALFDETTKGFNEFSFARQVIVSSFNKSESKISGAA